MLNNSFTGDESDPTERQWIASYTVELGRLSTGFLAIRLWKETAGGAVCLGTASRGENGMLPEGLVASVVSNITRGIYEDQVTGPLSRT